MKTIIILQGGGPENEERIKKDIGQRMRKIRKALGYTQEQMVSDFHIGRANYSRIEKGEIFPGPVIL